MRRIVHDPDERTPSQTGREMLEAIAAGAITLHRGRPHWTSQTAGLRWVRIGEHARGLPTTDGPVWIGSVETRVLERLVEQGQVRRTRHGYKTTTTGAHQ